MRKGHLLCCSRSSRQGSADGRARAGPASRTRLPAQAGGRGCPPPGQAAPGPAGRPGWPGRACSRTADVAPEGVPRVPLDEQKFFLEAFNSGG